MWRSGWLGIDAYGLETHGFVDLGRDRDGTVGAEVHWMAATGDVHTPFRLRHDPARGSVDLLANFGDDVDPDTEFEDGPDTGAAEGGPAPGWSVEDSVPVPADLARHLTLDAPPAAAFAAMASLHAGMFVVLDDATGLDWDHHWLPGPGRDELWRPADLGSPTATFARRSAATDG